MHPFERRVHPPRYAEYTALQSTTGVGSGDWPETDNMMRLHRSRRLREYAGHVIGPGKSGELSSSKCGRACQHSPASTSMGVLPFGADDRLPCPTRPQTWSDAKGCEQHKSPFPLSLVSAATVFMSGVGCRQSGLPGGPAIGLQGGQRQRQQASSSVVLTSEHSRSGVVNPEPTPKPEPD